MPKLKIKKDNIAKLFIAIFLINTICIFGTITPLFSFDNPSNMETTKNSIKREAILEKSDKISFKKNDINPVLDVQKIFKNNKIALATKNVYAILIGIERYQWLSDLNYCVLDARDMRYYLMYGCNVPDQNIIILENSEATRAGLIAALTQIQIIIDSDDVFFFYFSGHGGEDSGQHFICPYDTDPYTLANVYMDSNLALQLQYMPSVEKYVIIDSCNSGGMILESQDSGRYIITACDATELSIETIELRNGVFTYYFIDSFYNGVDINSDGVMSMEEQFSDLAPKVTSYCAGYQHSQHPRQYDGIAGHSIIPPALTSLLLSSSANVLTYSFNLYGNGNIETINMSVCSVDSDIIVKTEDLKNNTSTSHGFEHYSGSIELDPGEDITSYEILVEINGYSKKIFRESYGDTDLDGLTDIFEILQGNGIDPRLNDTDFDGLNDYVEYYGNTNPLINDTDNDGMLDGYEVENGLNPISDDTELDLDGDGLGNFIEHQIGSYVNDADTDNDGMLDGYEYFNDLEIFIMDEDLDKDEDGLINLLESQIGSSANNTDSDEDTMPDFWEYHNNLDLINDDTNQDYDSDDLINLIEYQLGTYANNSDSEGDGMPDGWEIEYSLNPLIDDSSLDFDNDKLSNLQEYFWNTEADNPDTDGDGWKDGTEVKYGTNPLDPDYYPDPPNKIPGYDIYIIFTSLLIGLSYVVIKIRIRK